MKTVLEYLERAAQQHPDKTAVIEEEKSITYRELRDCAKKIGSGLLKYNQTRKPVALLMEKGIETLELFLGIAYSGNFYTLLNPEFPQSRLCAMVDTLEAELLIVEDSLEQWKEIFPEKQVLAKNEVTAEIDEAALEKVRRDMTDCDPLYLNFTSGSTGVPKGVLVSHRSVIDFIDVFARTFEFSETDVFANQAPFDFDVSVKDIYTSLCVAGTLVIVPRPLFSNPAKLLDYLCDHDITVMVWAVSALCLISTFHGLDYKVPDRVRKVLFSGEVMPLKHLKDWLVHLPDAQFVNLYGPTEITCNCTYHIIDRQRDYAEGIPIGTAFDNERVLLLDENGEAAKDAVGEICVAGTALALGYYNNREETEKRFVQNPQNQSYPELLYKTGDLGALVDGELYFKGRKDFQIKYQGHRIELEEIEKAIMEVEGVRRAVCVFQEKKGRLYGFYIGDVDKTALTETLQAKLPAHMIPGVIKQVEDFALTKNGKVDRAKLLEDVNARR